MFGFALNILTAHVRAVVATIKILNNIAQETRAEDIATDTLRYTLIGKEKEPVMNRFLDFDDGED